jgi:hypothetical protein
VYYTLVEAAEAAGFSTGIREWGEDKEVG